MLSNKIYHFQVLFCLIEVAVFKIRILNEWSLLIFHGIKGVIFRQIII